MHNTQQKAELSPPRRQDAHLPPIELKISDNLFRQTWCRRTKCRGFRGVPGQKVSNNWQKAPKHKVGPLVTNDLRRPVFGRFQLFHCLSLTAGRHAPVPRRSKLQPWTDYGISMRPARRELLHPRTGVLQRRLPRDYHRRNSQKPRLDLAGTYSSASNINFSPEEVATHPNPSTFGLPKHVTSYTPNTWSFLSSAGKRTNARNCDLNKVTNMV